MAIKSAGEDDPYFAQRRMQTMKQRNAKNARLLKSLTSNREQGSLAARFRRSTQPSADLFSGSSSRFEQSDPWKTARGFLNKFI